MLRLRTILVLVLACETCRDSRLPSLLILRCKYAAGSFGIRRLWREFRAVPVSFPEDSPATPGAPNARVAHRQYQPEASARGFAGRILADASGQCGSRRSQSVCNVTVHRSKRPARLGSDSLGTPNARRSSSGRDAIESR